MMLQITSVVLFNLIMYKTIKGISGNKVVHIWVFTIAFQLLFDIFIDYKYKRILVLYSRNRLGSSSSLHHFNSACKFNVYQLVSF